MAKVICGIIFVRACRAAVLLGMGAWSAGPALAFDKPPLSPDQVAPLVAQSHVAATVRFSGNALARELDREIPRRLATFEDRLTSCGQRRFLGRQINIACVYSGYVERTAPIDLRAEGDRLEAAIKLAGFVAGQGARGLGRMLHGTAEGQMTVHASAHPRLTRDWAVALNLAEGFQWTDPPVLHIFGFEIGIARYVEPQIRSQMHRVEGEVAAKMKALDVRRKAETAWRRAFEPLQIADNVWLRMSPQSVAFAGIHSRSDILEGAIELTGSVETVLGAAAPPSAPTPLPELGSDVSDPGRFEFLIPVFVNYQVVREAVQAAASAALGTTVRDVDVYPSRGKLIIGLKFDTPPAGVETSDGWVYLAASLRANADDSVLQSADAELAGNAAAAGSTAAAKLIDAIRRQVFVSYKAEHDRLLAAASTKLSRDLGDGFRSEGSFTAAGVDKIILLPDSIQIVVRATGDLRIVFAP